MELNKTTQTALSIVAIVAIYKLSQKFGLVKTSDEILNQGLEDSPVNWWNKNEWKKFNWNNTKQLQVHAKALRVARILRYDVFGYFSDDFTKAFGALKEMDTQAEISFLVDVFNYEYSKDLYQWLQNGNWTAGSGFNSSNIATINKYISKLPKN